MLTVLITTYNDCYFLRYSIPSILTQSFTKFELLIIDDGSSDDTREIIKNFQDDRITYLYKEHAGRSSALNYGLKLAKYDWIVLADSDDIMYPEKLKIYSDQISNRNNKIVWSNCFYFNHSRILFYIKNPVIEEELKKFFLLHSLNNCCLVNRNHIFEHSNGYSEEIQKAEDYDMWLNLVFKSELVVIPEYLTLINLRSQSFSRSNIEKTNSQIYEIQKKIYENNLILKKYNPKSENEVLELRGWREYFYGDKEKAKNYFLQLGIYSLLKPRILMAYILCHLRNDFLLLFKSLVLKYKILYLLNYFADESKRARRLLKNHLTTWNSIT